MTGPPKTSETIPLTRFCIERVPDELAPPTNIPGKRYTLCLPPIPPGVQSAHDFLNMLRANPDAVLVTINTIVDMLQTLTGPISQPPPAQSLAPDPLGPP